MAGEIVFEGTTKRRESVCYSLSTRGDAEAMCSYIDEAFQEHTLIRFQGEINLFGRQTKNI